MSIYAIRDKMTGEECRAWDVNCSKDVLIEFLKDSGQLEIDESRQNGYFQVDYFGQKLAYDKNSVVVIYDYEDDGAAITNVAFAVMPREDFENTCKIDREILFYYGEQNEYEVFVKDGDLWYLNQADQTGSKVKDTPKNRAEVLEQAEKESLFYNDFSALDVINTYAVKLDLLQSDAKSKGLSSDLSFEFEDENTLNK